MKPNKKYGEVRGMVVTLLVFLNAVILENGYTINGQWYFLLALTIPLLVVAGYWRRQGLSGRRSKLFYCSIVLKKIAAFFREAVHVKHRPAS